MNRILVLVRWVLLVASAATVPAQVVSNNVTSNRLLNAGQEPQNWLTYSGTYMSQRHSTLVQITPQNVKALEQQWVFQARSLEKFDRDALVGGGLLYPAQRT